MCNAEAGPGAALRVFDIPADGTRLHVTVHAPGLVALGDLQQELTFRPGHDSDVVRFGLRTAATGLHQVTTRAFRGGTFLGEVHCQISVEHDGPTRDGRPRTAPLPSMAFEPGEPPSERRTPIITMARPTTITAPTMIPVRKRDPVEPVAW
ncbi:MULTISPECIES: hypothetical protein [unclassified Streptomyces]|uniref:hypothetical protein n=1 Tax=unclassified Streptomyces TaxID=2593676 RepID=UPI002E10E1E0|nr:MULTISPECIES: hypothetical protein [unclassified Streptomyces]WSR23290.1 hypothetical protein OG573_31930 [Streptomyces sp. NBC_01205]